MLILCNLENITEGDILGQVVQYPSLFKSDSTLNKPRGGLLINRYTLMSWIDLKSGQQCRSLTVKGPPLQRVSCKGKGLRRTPREGWWRGQKQVNLVAFLLCHGSHPISVLCQAFICAAEFLSTHIILEAYCIISVINMVYLSWFDANMAAETLSRKHSW